MSTDQTGPEIERGTYEIIRDRLIGHGKTLAERAEELNKKRRPDRLVVVIGVRRRFGQNVIDQAVLFGVIGGQKEVAIRIRRDFFDRLPTVLAEDFVDLKNRPSAAFSCARLVGL